MINKGESRSNHVNFWRDMLASSVRRVNFTWSTQPPRLMHFTPKMMRRCDGHQWKLHDGDRVHQDWVTGAVIWLIASAWDWPVNQNNSLKVVFHVRLLTYLRICPLQAWHQKWLKHNGPWKNFMLSGQMWKHLFQRSCLTEWGDLLFSKYCNQRLQLDLK